MISMHAGNVKTAMIGPLLLVVFFSLSVIGAEFIARSLGYLPWRFVVRENELPMHEYSATLGWRSKQGEYTIAPYVSGESEIHTTFLAGGLRRTYEHQNDTRDNRPKIVFAGGSYTQGWAISDDETFPWKVQEALPFFEVLNYGTNGYGTYQSLLSLESLLPDLDDPKIVFYGFVDHHENRNVAAANWQRILSKYSPGSSVFLPYVSMDKKGGLIRYEPEAQAEFLFRERSALISGAESAYMNIKSRRRENLKTQVTEKILLEIRQRVTSTGAQFVVVMLRASEETKLHYAKFLTRNDIPAIDCLYPFGDDFMVKGEGHPNGKMNSKWASCIVEFVHRNGLPNGVTN